MIVTHKPQAPARDVEAVGSRFGASTERTFPEIDARVLEFPDVKNERAREAREEALARIKRSLEQNPGIESVDYNYIREASFTPNDKYFDEQWGLKKIGAPKAWNTSKGNNMKIAVLDTGIDRNHPDLKKKIVLQKSFVGGGVADHNGHGTHVAGIAAAETNNKRGVAGACPECDLLVGKVLKDDGMGNDAHIIEGIIWAADQGAVAINLSFGGTADSDAERNAINYAWKEGSVVVAAAGNDGDNAKLYPAAYPNAIAVAATNKKDERASFSNYGNWISVSAPGVSILSTVPGGGYEYWRGTSMATPHVAGLAGLLAAKRQVNTAAKNRGIIESTAVDAGPAGKDKNHGGAHKRRGGRLLYYRWHHGRRRRSPWHCRGRGDLLSRR